MRLEASRQFGYMTLHPICGRKRSDLLRLNPFRNIHLQVLKRRFDLKIGVSHEEIQLGCAEKLLALYVLVRTCHVRKAAVAKIMLYITVGGILVDADPRFVFILRLIQGYCFDGVGRFSARICAGG